MTDDSGIDAIGRATLEREAAIRKQDEDDFRRFGRTSDGRLASTLSDEEFVEAVADPAKPSHHVRTRKRASSMASVPEALDEGEDGFIVGS